MTLQSNFTCWFRALLIPAMVSFTFVPGISAQEATPEVVPASECVTEPRTIEGIYEFLATPVANPGYSEPAMLPAGTEVDPDTRAELEDTFRQLVACFNTGDGLRVLSLYSEDYLRSLFTDPETGEISISDEDLSELATPIPVSERGPESVSVIREMAELPDGRIAVVFEADREMASSDDQPLTFIYVKIDDRWLIDGRALGIEHTATPEA
jgi:hypothetical protein